MKSLTRSFSKTYDNLKLLEQQKHLEPKFSYYCKDLALFLGFEDHKKKSQDYLPHTSIHTDFDFHILNDVIACDNSRQTPTKLLNRRITPMLNAKSVRRTLEKSKKFSRKSLVSEKPLRSISKRASPNLYEVGSTRSYHSTSKKKKFQKLDPARLYHDQAMTLIYTAIGD